MGICFGAQKRTRTSTSIRTLAPEASASTNIIRDLLNSAVLFTRSFLPVNCQMCANVDQMCPLRIHEACLFWLYGNLKCSMYIITIHSVIAPLDNNTSREGNHKSSFAVENTFNIKSIDTPRLFINLMSSTSSVTKRS